MTIIVPLAPIASFFAEHPWPTVVLLVLVGVVLPGIWSRKSARRAAAAALTRELLDTAVRIVKALGHGIRS